MNGPAATVKTVKTVAFLETPTELLKAVDSGNIQK